DYIGSFEVGKYADLIVLNKDPLTIHEDELRTISVMLTMVGGKTEYQWPTHIYPDPSETTQTNLSLFITLLAISCLVIVRKLKKNNFKLYY
ncbi:MAG: amidohydrolase family protein, partial [Candidatus Heimdallarchaeota archaeon]|nr:amidohydrolase family protein [Candidatus Heimdallarchaeota archaeon]